MCHSYEAFTGFISSSWAKVQQASLSFIQGGSRTPPQTLNSNTDPSGTLDLPCIAITEGRDSMAMQRIYIPLLCLLAPSQEQKICQKLLYVRRHNRAVPRHSNCKPSATLPKGRDKAGWFFRAILIISRLTRNSSREVVHGTGHRRRL